MAIKWEAYDVHDQFDLFEATCLWLEIEPSGKILDNVPPAVTSLFLAMKQFFDGYTLQPKGSWEGFIDSNSSFQYLLGAERYAFPWLLTRQQLIEYANKVEQRPKFLFPEERVSFRAIPNPKDNKPETPLLARQYNTRYIKTLLRLIKALAIALNWLPTDSRTVGRLLNVVQSNGIPLTDDTIRRALRDAFEVDKKTEKTD